MRWVLVILLLPAVFVVSCQAVPTFPTEAPPRTQPPETSLPPSPTTSAEEAVALAKNHLAQQLGIAETEIELVSIQNVVWPDASLGVPEPGKVYAQVIVPGFRIVLSAQGKEYVYHAGKVGEKMVVIQALPEEKERPH